ncbi:7746_t:CDS:2 [Paraglomus brasilianum]|uniref:7746_t:CDS:1 n=1 Tax=Paraglomus brasilianum TaxID=144538 RepID=A0A9N9D7A5_9GLOM|nr:7746_t:CDS:2 [Paraglomus brasilianum]
MVEINVFTDVDNVPSTPGDITFPKSNTTFICLSYDRGFEKDDATYLIPKVAERIKASSRKYRNVFVLLSLKSGNSVPLYEIQTRLLSCSSAMTILPIHNLKEAMLFLEAIYNAHLACNLVDNLDDPTFFLTTNRWVYLISQMSTERLRLHDCYVMQEGLRTIYNVATATEPQLLDCSLDRETAKYVIRFFEENRLI